jgi:hypothetical protein
LLAAAAAAAAAATTARRRIALLAAGDLAVLLAFAAVGRVNHGEPLTVGDTLTTALPFIVGELAMQHPSCAAHAAQGGVEQVFFHCASQQNMQDTQDTQNAGKATLVANIEPPACAVNEAAVVTVMLQAGLPLVPCWVGLGRKPRAATCLLLFYVLPMSSCPLFVSCFAAGWFASGALLGGCGEEAQGGDMHARTRCLMLMWLPLFLLLLQAGAALERCWADLQRKHKVAACMQVYFAQVARLLYCNLQAGLPLVRCWVASGRKRRAATQAQPQQQQPRRGLWAYHLALSSAASAGALVAWLASLLAWCWVLHVCILSS